MRTLAALAIAASIAGAEAHAAPLPAAPDRNCPPEIRQNTPGADPKTDLSDKLAQSRGVICPPAVDPDITQKPPAGGALKVVPPPGSPGGDPTIKPK